MSFEILVPNRLHFNLYAIERRPKMKYMETGYEYWSNCWGLSTKTPSAPLPPTPLFIIMTEGKLFTERKYNIVDLSVVQDNSTDVSVYFGLVRESLSEM